MRAGIAAVLLVAAAVPAAGQPSSRQDQVIDVRNSRVAAGNSFEALWGAMERAERKGDLAAAQQALREIRRLRIERNVRSLETLALARVADGMAALEAGDVEKASARFADAVALDPHLPDPHFGLARAEMKRGPLGILPAVKEVLAGTSARLTSGRGALDRKNLVRAALLLTLFLTVLVFAALMVLRHGALLRHDFEEGFGMEKRSLAFGVATALLLLPAITFQGWGWLPLWWLALLFAYMSPHAQSQQASPPAASCFRCSLARSSSFAQLIPPPSSPTPSGPGAPARSEGQASAGRPGERSRRRRQADRLPWPWRAT